MEFIDMGSNSVNEDKSRAFTSMLEKKGFAFPPSLIAGNGTARKEYDNGYMMTDAAGKLYNVRMQAGRPYVRPIALPDGVCPAHMAVTEFRARDMLAFLFDTQGRFWVLTSEYDMMQVEIPPFYPERMSMVIIGNMFDWTIRVGADDGEHLYAVDAQTLERIGTYTFPQPEPSVAERIGKPGMIIIFPQILDPFFRKIADRINVSKYCHRITVAGKRVHCKCRIDQRIGSGKGIVLCSRKHMIIPDGKRDALHHFHLRLSDPDAVRIFFKSLVALSLDLFCQEPSLQMV